MGAHSTTLALVAALAVPLTHGCAAELEADDETGSMGPFVTDRDGAVHTTTVDASDYDLWRHLDLDRGEPTDGEDDGWDLAFQRFLIKSNGGTSGDGGVAVLPVEDEAFDDLSVAPSSAYFEDADDGDDEDGDPDLVFLSGERWYAYDGSDHTLSPNPIVYVVRSTDERYYKVEILGYYSEVGSSGHLSFRWAEIEPPAGELDVRPAKGAVAPSTDTEGQDPEDQDPEDQDAEDQDAEDQDTEDQGGAGGDGCYDLGTHTCGCDVDESTCLDDGGMWTPACECGGD